MVIEPSEPPQEVYSRTSGMSFQSWRELHDELPDGAFLAKLEEDGFDLSEVLEVYGEEITAEDKAISGDPEREEESSTLDLLDAIREHLENAELEERARRGERIDPEDQMWIQGEERAAYLRAARELASLLPLAVAEPVLQLMDGIAAPDADLNPAFRTLDELARTLQARDANHERDGREL